MATQNTKNQKLPLIKTQNSLSEKIRQQSITLLNHLLIDILDLGLQTKQAHWNVKGPNFIGLHLLFDEAAESVGKFTDEIAERIVQLGGTALGTVDVIAKQSRLPKFPLDIHSGQRHVKAISTSLAVFGESVRSGIDATDDIADAGTSDLLTDVSRSVDVLLWKVESHSQAKD